MYEEAKPGQTAFDPGTPIIIGTGALGCSKLEATTRYAEEEPPTLFGNVGMGGSFAPELKFAGYDNIVIKGRAKKPVYIHVENEDVELRDASGVWGKGIFETNKIIHEELGDPEARILAIGQAGERLVRSATVESEYRSGTTLGACFGAKNLKAVVVRGTKGVKVYDPETILEINEKQTGKMKEAWERGESLADETGAPRTKYPMIGPTSVHGWFKRMDIGVIGHYEYHELDDWPDIEKIKAPEWANEHLVARMGCRGCSRACMSIFRTEAGTSLMRCFPFWWQWKVWISDLNPIFEASMLMSDYGLENGSVATMVSWLMYAYNEGVITAKDTDGIPMERGSVEALMSITHKIAKREGFGDILAEGPLTFVRKLGGERGKKAEKLLMHRRGLVPRTVDMRIGVHYALEEAVALRGNSHRAGYPPMLWLRSWDGTEEETKVVYEHAKKTYGSEKAIIP